MLGTRQRLYREGGATYLENILGFRMRRWRHAGQASRGRGDGSAANVMNMDVLNELLLTSAVL